MLGYLMALAVVINFANCQVRTYRASYFANASGVLAPEHLLSEEFYDAEGNLSSSRSWETGVAPQFSGRLVSRIRTGDVTIERFYDTQFPTRTGEFQGLLISAKDGSNTVATIRVIWGQADSPKVTFITSSGTVDRDVTAKRVYRKFLNANGWVSTLKVEDAQGLLLVKHSYTYDKLGSLTSDLMISPEGRGLVKLEWVYTYNDLSTYWITREESRTYYGDTTSVTSKIWKDRREIVKIETR